MRLKLERAVVIGGSIAGLLAARVLAEHFESVKIVESDRLPLNPQMRKGVPQSVQPHVLFTRGYRILEELFPGIGSQLSAAGALTFDWAREFHLFTLGRWSQTAVPPSNIISFTCSRPLLEWAIRQRLREFAFRAVCGTTSRYTGSEMVNSCLHAFKKAWQKAIPYTGC